MLRRIPADTAPPEPAEIVASKVDDERRMAEVLDAINGLPKREQDVIAVCVFAGLDYAAAAVALGVPVGTVRSRLSRARRRITSLVPPISPHRTDERRSDARHSR